jgi:hypothetical protein
MNEIIVIIYTKNSLLIKKKNKNKTWHTLNLLPPSNSLTNPIYIYINISLLVIVGELQAPPIDIDLLPQP